MASLENLAYEQAGSYKHYLEKPESHTVEETVEFSIWKAFNYSPADIRSIGQENAEIAGEKYDIEKIVQEYETKKSRFGLAKEQIMAVFNIASSHIKFAFRWWPHIIGFKEPKGSNKIVELRRFFKNFDLESHRFLVADEAARNLGGTGRKEYTAQILDEEAKEALLKAEKYELPKSPKQKRSDEKPQSEEGEKNEVVADTFEWIYKKYKEYLSLPEKEKRRQSYYFRNLEERGIKLEDLKDQEKTLTEWLGRLKVYGKRLENLTEDELRREMKFSFLTSVTKQVFENSEKKSGSEVLLDLGVSVFKTYKAASELEKRKFLRAS
ncbi:MAG: hypothetical protein COU47_04480 [Candidatus Niyogibacteria bacterium CG10_big_fil_rev_8_21_14_0_10_46_36]|uniref:Uncharacterized protein n=1 Tax=Candidatus Niyogibacteria bacterium CG10_big_fil_rev_8_21_14_0_10_46_36 TaxID=1974726 RepID=A0A2H0TC97_9BACT|nr:MAG: hypothetical protein COU47_04480 [Candidatus Niyogibacteria bacterium CG10_big_fil_rev_8_21_14_0_10_46_36]